MIRILGFVMCAAAAVAPAWSLAGEPAGTVIFAVGKVEQRSPDGTIRALAKGDVVQEGDTLLTGPDSHAQLVMSDRARIALRPGSALRLAAYRYSGADDGREQATLELMKGAFRSLTGAIGTTNKKSYLIKSGMHTIGVRGTDHETWRLDSGTYNRVTVGGTYLEGANGRVDLEPAQTGFAGLTPDSPPLRLASTPQFLLASFGRAHANTAPWLRPAAGGDERRLRQSVGAGPAGLKVERLHAVQPFGDAARNGGFGRSGRCGGPCNGRLLP